MFDQLLIGFGWHYQTVHKTEFCGQAGTVELSRQNVFSNKKCIPWMEDEAYMITVDKGYITQVQ